MQEKRLPRKVKKLLKKEAPHEYNIFLERKKAYKEREEHIDILFPKDYNYKDVKKTYKDFMYKKI